MSKMDYAYSVAYIRSIENTLLTKSDYEALIAAKSTAEAIQILFDKGYGEALSPEEPFETLLENELQKAWDMMRGNAPEKELVDILLFENDFANLKLLLKSVFSSQKEYALLLKKPYTCPPDRIYNALLNRRFDDLPEMLKASAEEAFSLLSASMEADRADACIDKAAMEYTFAAAYKTGNAFLIRLFLLKNTQQAIKIAYRSALWKKTVQELESAIPAVLDIERSSLIKAALAGEDAVIDCLSHAGYEEAAQKLSHSSAAFEKYCDDQRMALTEGARYTAFGFEPLAAYIMKKQAEIQNVRMILTAKSNEIEEDVIRQRLRDAV